MSEMPADRLAERLEELADRIEGNLSLKLEHVDALREAAAALRQGEPPDLPCTFPSEYGEAVLAKHYWTLLSAYRALLSEPAAPQPTKEPHAYSDEAARADWERSLASPQPDKGLEPFGEACGHGCVTQEDCRAKQDTLARDGLCGFGLHLPTNTQREAVKAHGGTTDARAREVPTPGSFGGLENREEVIAKPSDYMTCPKCKGSGCDPYVHPFQSPGREYPCPTCAGNGRIRALAAAKQEG